MPKQTQAYYAEVLLPLAIPKTYTYAVPIDLVPAMTFGIRVEVPLRNKLYSGIVMEIHQKKPITKTKNIIATIDEQPIINEEQFEFWKWMAHYYCAGLGGVMNVALPSGLKMSSESKFVLNEGQDLTELELTDDEYLVAEALTFQHEMTIDTIQDILNKKTVYPILKGLMVKRVIYIKEELKTKYKPKKESFIHLTKAFIDQPEKGLALTAKSERQSRALLSIYSLARKNKDVAKKAVYELANVDNSVIKRLAEKGIINVFEKEVSRILLEDSDQDYTLSPLSDEQTQAKKAIKESFKENKVALLHGVTGSGKTRVYIDLILEQIALGGQVLLLLPEIALTTQIVERLKVQIGDVLHVYHSKISDHQRVEIWNAARFANKLFVGARSSIFLPFSNLKLIIVDEEHDHSYKQDNPSPRYQGRDSAVVLAKMFGADLLLGTATPSLESMYNCNLGKYNYVSMSQRYGAAELPDIEIVDLKDAYKKGLIKEHFSTRLIDEIKAAVERGEQVILFQNRRGYAPIQRCNFCGWTAECSNCDVTLTYHQAINDLKCHYCGYRQRHSDECPACGNHEMQLIGSGTQKVEEVLQELIPEIRVARFDYDTTRSKGNQEKLLYDFKTRKIDVLVGTQMITKGFDFDHISLVGVLSADGLFSYPDFRSAERGFQLLLQVAGRAGRRDKKGLVLIQTFNPSHPVLKNVIEHDYKQFFLNEIAERKENVFPPVYNLIAIWLRHIDLKKTKKAAQKFGELLTSKLGRRVQGPIDPPLIRVRNQYQQVIYIKMEKDIKVVQKVKLLVEKVKNHLKADKEIRQVSVTIDVDPY